MRFGTHNSSWLDGPEPAEAFEAVVNFSSRMSCLTLPDGRFVGTAARKNTLVQGKRREAPRHGGSVSMAANGIVREALGDLDARLDHTTSRRAAPREPMPLAHDQ